MLKNKLKISICALVTFKDMKTCITPVPSIQLLRSLCKTYNVCPSSFVIQNRKLLKVKAVPEAEEAYRKVWRGDYSDQEVAIKEI
ncbi:hypothetical protein CERSUDRAFT_97703 [Gelatoporia subvermispora B]|uniref:Uncharacterized protein n=1 Tax=Ceriporiopsis subvermispora (strain B) TaxID=914234 RepID=M2PEZ0_CERS8|nr:hypothetical protein CERSUDRAFT_97703 [Gelatoporia subvermispora B]